jgi:hypothetical protein
MHLEGAGVQRRAELNGGRRNELKHGHRGVSGDTGRENLPPLEHTPDGEHPAPRRALNGARSNLAGRV